jgi:hypothetical protein
MNGPMSEVEGLLYSVRTNANALKPITAMPTHSGMALS